jgi:CheY-like chemotaxis protein
MISDKKVLIVEDDADVRLGYHLLLAAHHYDTFFAPDVLSAVAEAQTNKPDLIILDLGLPAVPRSEYNLPMPQPDGGFLVLERLQADAGLSGVPVVIVSGRDPHANEERALRGGAVAFLQKPWDNDKLLAIISHLLDAPAPPILSS